MESPSKYPETSTERYRVDYWASKPNNWTAGATADDPTQDTQSPFPTGQSTDYVEDDGWPDEHATTPETVADCVAKQDAKSQPEAPTNATGSQAADRKDGFKDYSRGDIELQPATVTEYIRNKKLQPMEWICCSCYTEQRYRDNLDPLNRLRCQYPRCGVSDKGFRIYRVHDMCDQCTVFVDQRAPVTRKALKKKREEVREVLKKIKKIYENIDRLAEFDEQEAEKMAGLIEQREAREELEREKQEEEDLYQAEMDKQLRDEWEDEDADSSGTESRYADSVWQEEEEEEEQVEQGESKRKPQKKGGFKMLLGL